MASEGALLGLHVPAVCSGDLRPCFLDKSESDLGAEARQVIMFTQQPALSCPKL